MKFNIGDRVVWKGKPGFIGGFYSSGSPIVVFDEPDEWFHGVIPEYPGRCYILPPDVLHLDEDYELIEEVSRSQKL